MKVRRNDRPRCPECDRPLKPFTIDDGDLGRAIHPDYDTWFERLAWACLPCGGNGFVFNAAVQRRLAAGEISSEDVITTARVDTWGRYQRRKDRKEAG